LPESGSASLNKKNKFKSKEKTQVDMYKAELKDLYKQAENKSFPKVIFTIAGCRKKYTQIVNFFDGPREFLEEPDEEALFDYKCKLCVIEGIKTKLFKCKPGKNTTLWKFYKVNMFFFIQ
jgi:hypothetical protein